MSQHEKSGPFRQKIKKPEHMDLMALCRWIGNYELLRFSLKLLSTMLVAVP